MAKLLEHVPRVVEARENVVTGDVRVVVEDLVLCPTIGKKSDHEFHGDSSPLDHGLADENLGVEFDPVFPGHATPPPRVYGNPPAHIAPNTPER